MMFDVQGALDEILSENITPAISASPAIPHLKLAEIARIAVRGVQSENIEFDTRATNEDLEIYAEALRIHGPMSYGMAMRVLHWGGTRAGQSENILRLAGRIVFNKQGRAILSDNENHQGEVVH